MLCIGAKATTIQVIDGLKYIIYTDQNYAVLTGNNYTQREIVIPASITWEGKKYPVTELGAKCFYKCTGLTSVTIPSSVTSLGDYCFSSCSSLTSVTIPSSVTSIGSYCFAYCSLLSVITIPSSVTSLPDDCFLISGLTSITIPSSVTSLGDFCFSGCSSLKSIDIPESVTSLGWGCFCNCTGLTSITIPSSVTKLGSSCFEDCYSLFSVDIKSTSITFGGNCFASTAIDDFTIMATTPPEITSSCFDKCNINLARLMVPKNSINDYRNSGWGEFGTISTATDFKPTTAYLHSVDGLQYIVYTDRGYAVLIANNYTQSEINIPASILFGGTEYPVKEIAGGCFDGCWLLTSVTIPSSVTSLGDRCFNCCTRLGSVNIPESVTSLGDECFSTCHSLAYIDIPSSVKSLGDNCFDNCWSLTSITIPSSITSLGFACFFGCKNLTSVSIPSSVTSLGGSCFQFCTSLTSVTIPSSVTNIENSCFEDCSGLTSIILPPSLTNLGNWCFDNCNNLATVYISPKEIYASKSDNWHFATSLSAYKDKLKPYIQFVTTDGTPYRYGTLCLKSQVFLKDGTCENMNEIYTVKSVDGRTAILSKVTTGVLEPGVAYIVANNDREGLTIPNGATFTLDETETLLDEPIKSSLLQGTFDDTYAPVGSYVLQPDGKFHIVAQANTILVGANRAYLNVPSGADNAPVMSMQFGGETTSIDGITETQKETDNSLYDLMGRRVTTPQKGQIYIRGGKKVIY